MQPLVSIVIPTKDRYEYLEYCVRTLVELKQKKNNIEIVVQDNSTDSESFGKLLAVFNNQISYYYEKDPLSVVDNCDLAISHAKGEYICMLGDDDSVADLIVEVALWMKMNDIESCIGRIVRYNWSDLVYDHHKFPSLTIPFCNKELECIDPMAELRRNLLVGAYKLGDLPKVYHAVVAKVALDRVKKASGSYFPGPSPDMANAIGLCFAIQNHVVINIPIIVSGFSYKSAGGMGTRRQHIGRIEDMKHLPKDTAVSWEKEIPKYWTGETIYAESALKALRKCNQSLWINEFNYNMHYAAFISYNHHFWKYALPFLKTFRQCVVVSYYCMKILFVRTGNYFHNALESRFHISKNLVYYDISSLEDAVSCVNEFNKKKSWNILKLKKQNR